MEGGCSRYKTLAWIQGRKLGHPADVRYLQLEFLIQNCYSAIVYLEIDKQGRSIDEDGQTRYSLGNASLSVR